MSRIAAVLVVIALACLGGAAQALRVPSAPRCPVFPASNPWNKRVDRLPVAQSSGTIIGSIGAGTGLHADFGSGLWEGSPIGIPFDVVSRTTPRARVTFEYDDESDHLGYPIPKGVHVEGGSDHHALLLDKSAAVSTSWAGSSGVRAAGTPGPEPPGACARTGSGPQAGRRPMPPDCRSSPVSPATTRCAAA